MAVVEREVEVIEVSGVIKETPVLTVTPAAAKMVKGVLEEKGLVDYGLRVFVAGGGCSGMQYGMQFEESPQSLDTVVKVDGINFFVDATSMEYISGATIDYVDSLMGGGFRIENPNAVSSCGCGTSFRTEGSPQGHAHEGAGCAC